MVEAGRGIAPSAAEEGVFEPATQAGLDGLPAVVRAGRVEPEHAGDPADGLQPQQGERREHDEEPAQSQPLLGPDDEHDDRGEPDAARLRQEDAAEQHGADEPRPGRPEFRCQQRAQCRQEQAPGLRRISDVQADQPRLVLNHSADDVDQGVADDDRVDRLPVRPVTAQEEEHRAVDGDPQQRGRRCARVECGQQSPADEQHQAYGEEPVLLHLAGTPLEETAKAGEHQQIAQQQRPHKRGLEGGETQAAARHDGCHQQDFGGQEERRERDHGCDRYGERPARAREVGDQRHRNCESQDRRGLSGQYRHHVIPPPQTGQLLV
ncbi:hypothetical protein GCM10010381_02330 [Streptomyces xantholiticus]|nr:hypothetical protein GCM10010381_02330 [Streptomyces xantholiticus]